MPVINDCTISTIGLANKKYWTSIRTSCLCHTDCYRRQYSGHNFKKEFVCACQIGFFLKTIRWIKSVKSFVGKNSTTKGMATLNEQSMHCMRLIEDTSEECVGDIGNNIEDIKCTSEENAKENKTQEETFKNQYQCDLQTPMRTKWTSPVKKKPAKI